MESNNSLSELAIEVQNVTQQEIDTIFKMVRKHKKNYTENRDFQIEALRDRADEQGSKHNRDLVDSAEFDIVQNFECMVDNSKTAFQMKGVNPLNGTLYQISIKDNIFSHKNLQIRNYMSTEFTNSKITPDIIDEIYY